MDKLPGPLSLSISLSLSRSLPLAFLWTGETVDAVHFLITIFCGEMNKMERISLFLGEYCGVIFFSLIKNRCCSFTRLTFLWAKRNLILAKIIPDLTCGCGSLFPVLTDCTSQGNSLPCKTDAFM